MVTNVYNIYRQLSEALKGFPGFKIFDVVNCKTKNNDLIESSVHVNERFSVLLTYFENNEKNNYGINFDEISLSNRYTCRNMEINEKIFDNLSFHLFNVFQKNGIDLSHQNIKEWERSFLKTDFGGNDDCSLLFSLFCEKIEKFRKQNNEKFLDKFFEFMKFEKYLIDFETYVSFADEKILINSKNITEIINKLKQENKYAISFNFQNLMNIDIIKNNDIVYIYSNDEETNIENIMQNKISNYDANKFETFNILENIIYNIITVNQFKKEPETDFSVKL